MITTTIDGAGQMGWHTPSMYPVQPFQSTEMLWPFIYCSLVIGTLIQKCWALERGLWEFIQCLGLVNDTECW